MDLESRAEEVVELERRPGGERRGRCGREEEDEGKRKKKKIKRNG